MSSIKFNFNIESEKKLSGSYKLQTSFPEKYKYIKNKSFDINSIDYNNQFLNIDFDPTSAQYGIASVKVNISNTINNDNCKSSSVVYLKIPILNNKRRVSYLEQYITFPIIRQPNILLSINNVITIFNYETYSMFKSLYFFERKYEHLLYFKHKNINHLLNNYDTTVVLTPSNTYESENNIFQYYTNIYNQIKNIIFQQPSNSYNLVLDYSIYTLKNLNDFNKINNNKLNLSLISLNHTSNSQSDFTVDSQFSKIYSYIIYENPKTIDSYYYEVNVNNIEIYKKYLNTFTRVGNIDSKYYIKLTNELNSLSIYKVGNVSFNSFNTNIESLITVNKITI